MMNQVMKPYPQIVSQMQVCEPQVVQYKDLAQPNQRCQILRSNMLSLNRQNAVPLQSPIYYPSRSIRETRKIKHPVTSSKIINKALVWKNPVVLCPDFAKIPGDPYSCHFLGQLEGTWQTNALHGVQISIKLVVESHPRFAIVRQRSTGGTVFSDQHIYAQTTQFTLCTVNGYVKAVMPKGMSMKYSLTWFTNNGSLMVWNRTGKLSFKLTATSPNSSPRSSTSSEILRSSPMSSKSVGQSGGVSPDVSMSVRPELSFSNRKSQVGLLDLDATLASSRLECAQYNFSEKYQRLSDDAAFELFRSECREHPTLSSKLLNWGTCLNANHPISEVADGRVWITAKLVQPTNEEDKKKLEAMIDTWKGAYQETKQGTYIQALSNFNGAKLQHRLKRSSLGLNMIEEWNFEDDLWSPCVKEHPYGNWIDLKNKGEMYKVQIVPMLNILSRMKKDWSSFEEMRKSFDSLFESRGQNEMVENLDKKINEMSLKLEKEYKFRFAARVARVADFIAKEMH